MIPLYPFKETHQKIKIFSHYQIFGSVIDLVFLIEDPKKEIEDMYPILLGEIVGTVYPGEDLWKTTCFEIFLKNKNSSDYYEFNFNSKGDWNLFYFSDYRNRVADHISHLNVRVFGENKKLSFQFDIEHLEHLSLPCQVNLASVIKVKSDTSYWSQKHNKIQPDFHDANNFSLTLKSSEGGTNHG